MTSRCGITENMRNRCIFMIFIKWNETLGWILNAGKRCVVFSLLLIFRIFRIVTSGYPVFSKKFDLYRNFTGIISDVLEKTGLCVWLLLDLSGGKDAVNDVTSWNDVTCVWMTSHYDGTLTITLFVLGHFDFRTWQFYVISTFGPFEPLLFRYFTNCNFDVWTFHQYSFRHLDFSY